MANLFTKALSNLTNKSYLNPVSIKENSYLSIINNFFGFVLGKRTLKQYTESYGSNPLVYMIVHKIATTTATINRIYLDNNEELTDNPKLKEVFDNPNPDQTLIDFYTEIYENLLLTGNVYVRSIQAVGSIGFDYEVLVSYRIDINANSIGEVVSYEYLHPNGKTEIIPKDDILHIKTSNVVNVDDTEILYGLSPLQAAWIVVKSSTEKFKADAAIFKNRGIVGILTNDTDNAMLPQERERLQNEYDKEIGGSEKYNRIKVSTSRLRYIQTGMSPTDLKLLEGISSSLRILCSIYGISSILFNDNENSTYNNVAEAKRDAFTNVYIPLAKKVDKQLSKFIAGKEKIEESISVDLTSIEEVKSTTNETAQALNNMSPLLANRVLETMTIDEIRELASLQALENGEGERLLDESNTNVNATVNG